METGLVRIASPDYPEFFDDMDYDGLEHGILQSMLYLKRIPADRKFRFGEDVFDTALGESLRVVVRPHGDHEDAQQQDPSPAPQQPQDVPRVRSPLVAGHFPSIGAFQAAGRICAA
ncbi:MAG: hypothetical protein R6U27_13460, partial [Desulfobacterales bacterium]